MLSAAIDDLLAEYDLAQLGIDRDRVRLDREEDEVEQATLPPEAITLQADAEHTYLWLTSAWSLQIVPALLDAGLSDERIDQLRIGILSEIEDRVDRLLRSKGEV